jgi:hypothetical protein
MLYRLEFERTDPTTEGKPTNTTVTAFDVVILNVFMPQALHCPVNSGHFFGFTDR